MLRIYQLVRFFFTEAVYHYQRTEKVLYLTFDDGPEPSVTPFVLDELKKYGAKATFFCIGNNVKKHPLLYRQILDQGHRTGNHTYTHLKGWSVNTLKYLRDTEKAGILIQSPLFRPPYGRMRRSQFDLLKRKYQIILWDVISHDYNSAIPPGKILANVIDYTQNGSIIVFHDSLKAEKNLRSVLPEVLQHYSKLGYRFEAIPQ